MRPVLPVSLLAHSVLLQALSYALRPAVSYDVLHLDAGSSWLGVVAAAFALPPLLTALFAGNLNDRLGERTSLLLGSVACLLATSVCLLAGRTLVGLISGSVLLGLGMLFAIVGQQAWVMRAAGAGRLDSSFGLYTLATSSGQLLGPLALLLPGAGSADSASLPVVGPVLLVASLVCVGLAAAVPAADGRAARDVPAEEEAPARPGELLRRRGVLRALATSSLVLASLDVTVAYLPLLAQERGLSPAWTAGLMVARGGATMVSRLGLSALTGALGRRRVLVAGSGFAALGLGTLALPAPAAVLLVSVLVYGLAAGTVQPLTMSWMTLITSPRQRGVTASLRLVGNRVGQTLVPLVVGAVSTGGGAAVAFAATGSSLVLSAWCARAAPEGDARSAR
ncbi:MFS transporter [Kineococcus sp. SYSU DK003]|uniref:MFS transporter n=1 Tax=Kineococcus sp. SYSU DK003 TaxID=3383124 RepID=UPI003D7D0FA9